MGYSFRQKCKKTRDHGVMSVHGSIENQCGMT